MHYLPNLAISSSLAAFRLARRKSDSVIRKLFFAIFSNYSAKLHKFKDFSIKTHGFYHFFAEARCNFAVMKETVQICNNGHLLDWMENGTLEIVLTEIFTNEHKNLSQSFRFGSKFALDFPSQSGWRITAPNERCRGRHTQIARQWKIKRYNKQRITLLGNWLADYLRDRCLEN